MSERSTAMGHTADESRTVRLTIPAKAEYITLSRLALTGLARVRPLAEDTLADLKLALTEACSNSVRHAYADGDGQVRISFELLDDRLVVEVADEGSGFEPEGAGRELGGDELTEGGLGIAIIRSIADELEIGAREGGSGSRLRFVKLL
ncbi:MAG TPA: ATP-binding protein [Gaiellaceae bacterium]|nr:ATP-binding protein [Gaiellaceae bacterium]